MYIQLFDSEKSLLKLLGGAQIKQVKVHNHSYCLINNPKGYFLTETSCPHMDYPLSDGKLNAQNELVCMWHSYRFDLTSGHESASRCRPLKTYPIEVKSNGALVVDLPT